MEIQEMKALFVTTAYKRYEGDIEGLGVVLIEAKRVKKSIDERFNWDKIVNKLISLYVTKEK